MDHGGGEIDTLSAGVGCEIVVPGLDDSGIEQEDDFSLEQEETSESLEKENGLNLCLYS